MVSPTKRCWIAAKSLHFWSEWYLLRGEWKHSWSNPVKQLQTVAEKGFICMVGLAENHRNTMSCLWSKFWLDRLAKAIALKLPALANRRGILVHQDDESDIDSDLPEALGAWLGQPHSPDLALSDYFLLLFKANDIAAEKFPSRAACENLLTFLKIYLPWLKAFCLDITMKGKLRTFGFKKYVAKQRPMVFIANKKKRLEFAKQYIPTVFSDKVIWSDESIFELRN